MNSRRLSPRKRDQILRAAVEVFREVGFERASTDAIAARARVSKATLYNHFEEKASLFAACVKAEAEALEGGALAACIPPAPSHGVESDLRALGDRLVRHLLSRSVHALHMVAMAEARRFPELARMLHERGFSRVRDIVAGYLEDSIPAGTLALDEPAVAAQHFIWLCVSDLKLRLDLGMEEKLRDGEIRSAVEKGVAAFLRAYGGPSPGSHLHDERTSR